MRPQFAFMMSLGLLVAALGCHHTAGVCDCDLQHDVHAHVLVPVPAPAMAPAGRPEPVQMPKSSE